MKKAKTNEGFISRIILIVVALIALKYFFHFDVIEWIKSEQVQSILRPIINVIKSIYNYLDGLVKSLVS